MTLRVDADVYDHLLDAARAAAPLEVCGLLGGAGGRVRSFHRLTNADASGEHYRMLPAEQFAAVKAMRAAGEELLAIVHSHPATPARMSAEDLRLAYTPDVAYVILSLAEPERPDLRAFAVEAGAARELALVIDTPARGTSSSPETA